MVKKEEKNLEEIIIGAMLSKSMAIQMYRY
jgi:hypothetical protein